MKIVKNNYDIKYKLKNLMVKSLLNRDEESNFSIDSKANTQINSGYAVGMTDIILTEQNFDKNLERFVNFLFDNNEIPYPRLVGGWVDKGLVYTDIGFILPDREKALKLAEVFDQKAIYDFANKRVIFLSLWDEYLNNVDWKTKK